MKLYADDRLVILNKPAGLPSHPGRAGGPSAEDCFPQLSRRRTGPWLAHRLDTDTAGCLAVALRKTTLIELQALFGAGRVEKLYWAIVHGDPGAASGRIDLPLLKRTRGAGWRMVSDPQGQSAVTDWRRLGTDGTRSWLELRPRTGRTHQLRVHCATLGCGIVGDAVYGVAEPARLHLLARALHLPLSPAASAQAPPPEHMIGALDACGYQSAAPPHSPGCVAL